MMKMKNLLLVLVLVMMGMTINAQPQTDKYGSDKFKVTYDKFKDNTYIQVWFIRKVLKNDVNVVINYGQKVKLVDAHKQYFVDDEGRKLVWYTPIGCLNYLYDKGFEVEDVTIQITGSTSYTYYLLKNKQK